MRTRSQIRTIRKAVTESQNAFRFHLCLGIDFDVFGHGRLTDRYRFLRQGLSQSFRLRLRDFFEDRLRIRLRLWLRPVLLNQPGDALGHFLYAVAFNNRYCNGAQKYRQSNRCCKRGAQGFSETLVFFVATRPWHDLGMRGHIVGIALDEPFVFPKFLLFNDIKQVVMQMIQLSILVADLIEDGIPPVFNATYLCAVVINLALRICKHRLPRFGTLMCRPEQVTGAQMIEFFQGTANLAQHVKLVSFFGKHRELAVHGVQTALQDGQLLLALLELGSNRVFLV